MDSTEFYRQEEMKAHPKIKSLKERGFLKSPLRDGPYNFVTVYF